MESNHAAGRNFFSSTISFLLIPRLGSGCDGARVTVVSMCGGGRGDSGGAYYFSSSSGVLSLFTPLFSCFPFFCRASFCDDHQQLTCHVQR